MYITGNYTPRITEFDIDSQLPAERGRQMIADATATFIDFHSLPRVGIITEFIHKTHAIQPFGGILKSFKVTGTP